MKLTERAVPTALLILQDTKANLADLPFRDVNWEAENNQPQINRRK